MVILPGLAQAQPAPTRRAAASAAALEAARRFLCPNGGTPQRGGRCQPSQDVTGWQRGLPAPSNAQAPCPPGTRAAVAAQPGVTRCIPG